MFDSGVHDPGQHGDGRVGEVRFATGRVSKKPNAEVVMPEDGYWLPAYLTYNLTALEGEELVVRGRKGGQASALARSAEPARSAESESQQEVQRQVQQEVEQQANEPSHRQVRSSQVKGNQTLNDGR